MDATRARILQKYDVSPQARLSSGMEAEVFAYGPGAVLKLYPGTANLAQMRILQRFYDALDRDLLPYAVPRIHSVAQESPYLVTIEERLAGTRMSALLPALSPDQLDAMMERYLAAALAVSNIEAPPTFDRYKLLDPHGISQRAQGDWHQFIAHYLALKLAQVAPHLDRDVSQLGSRLQQLYDLLDQPYTGDHRLIHGDFCPGNLLLGSQGKIAALLDFGLLTMYGDYLFDVATSWVFFDMYDELQAAARGRLLDIVLDRLGASVRGRLYRYVLIYSILSANTYAPDCTDGHYRWCVANLNNRRYWDAIE
jgi:aminoglycoside phosphotransferase (APT) family kinase protein